MKEREIAAKGIIKLDKSAGVVSYFNLLLVPIDFDILRIMLVCLDEMMTNICIGNIHLYAAAENMIQHIN